MSPTNAPRLSACVITLNEADRIGACLQSLGFCDELVVVDSGSTDGTRGLAAAAGARVIEHAFEGFRSQKDFAVAQARHDWVLCLDADERVTPALRAAIEAAREEGLRQAAGYRFARCTEYFGAFLW
ncbi:MAG: glycosyltransferase family 2 protein, partial [Rhodanobacteraceae bacterium]